MKLNIDVALGLEDVVTSVVARNCSSQTLWCYSARFKPTDAETLEFLTLQEALVQAKVRQLSFIVVEMDCKAVASALLDPVPNWRGKLIVEDIRRKDLISQDIIIRWTPRSSNFTVLNLA